MSNPSGRPWYHFSSTVRPTPYSSRHPSSPHDVIEPPLSPAALPSPPQPPRSIPNVVREAKSSPVLPSQSIQYDPPKPRHEREITRQNILTFSDKTNLVHEPKKEKQQQHDDELSPASQLSPSPLPQQMSPPLRSPSLEEVQEAKQRPVTWPMNHVPHKPRRQEHETTHQKNILTLSEKTNIHGPNKTLSSESDGDVIMDTQSVITISGENKGAVMEILQSPSKSRGPYSFIYDAGKSEGEKSESMNHSNNAGNGFVNSNVQMINSSVVYNSSETHRDPGVHLSFYRKPSSGNGFIIKDNGNGYTSSIN